MCVFFKELSTLFFSYAKKYNFADSERLIPMKNSNTMYRFAVVTAMIFIAAAARLVPHWPNFTPVAAIALFGGAFFGRKIWAFIIPLAAMFLSDLIIGFHDYMVAVYAGFALTVMLGWMLQKNAGVLRIGAASLVSSVLFFVITNFAVWFGSPFYTQDISGLMQCYTLAIPFFGYSVGGDLFYAAILFGAFAIAQNRIPSLAPAKA